MIYGYARVSTEGQSEVAPVRQLRAGCAIRARTAEGRSRAEGRGQHMGRPPKLTAAQQAEARRRRAEGATLAELARSYNVSPATISRLTAWTPK
jgi:DNA invertase Pin-like site-specific DNA recombinase